MGVVHYFWATKADDRGPTIVAVIVAILLGARVYWAMQKKKQQQKQMNARATNSPRSKIPIEA
jgi:DMSO/TMAO reductase YedYZ heme-binding membrane subunit